MMQRCGVQMALLTLLGLVMLLAAVPVRAQAPLAELQVNAFPGASNLPIWIAQREGMFARRGIEVTLSNPKGSLDQFKGMIEDRYPVIVTSFDNVLAYHSGRGAAEIGAIPDLIAVMAIDSGLLTFVASAGIEKIADLQGRTVAVDALSTGYSFALQDILRKAGVKTAEVSFIAVGNSDSRWKAMQEGRAQAALLVLPTDIDATEHGSKPLATVAASFDAFLGNAVVLRRSWAAGHRAELQAFLRGVGDALSWLLVSEHKARAIEILHAEMPALSAGNLERVYETLIDSRQGLSRNGVLDPRAVQTVISLRAKYAGSPESLEGLDAYIDTRYLSAEPMRK